MRIVSPLAMGMYVPLIGMLVVVLFVSIFSNVGFSYGDVKDARLNTAVQVSHAIASILFSYAQDHDGHYPEGSSSTEIFQHLIDENYVLDPTIFYIAQIPGKTPPKSKHLQPENVCWDLTCCVDSSSPMNLPLLFSTGYKVTYEPGAPALQISRSTRTWAEWWGKPDLLKATMIWTTKGMLSRSIHDDENSEVPNFIPADFDAKGKIYKQLTP